MLILKNKPTNPLGGSSRKWSHDFVAEQGRVMALAADSVTHEDFVQFCVGQIPRGGIRRDMRRQDIVRALKRMIGNGVLPFRIEGDRFVF